MNTSASPLMVDFIMSLDGYGAAEGWPGWWGMEGPEYLAWLGEQDPVTHLMGATTYREMAALVAAGEPGTDMLADADKVVFSRTLSEPLIWANTTLISEDAVAAVAEMKRTGSRTLATLGSVSLARSLLTAGLVDRFRVVIFPVITGVTGAARIFEGYPDVTLELVERRTFDNSTQLLEYVPTVLPGPGPTR